MELIKNEEKINSINAFMHALDDENQTLSKPEIYRKYESVLKRIRAIDILFLPMYQNDTSLSIDEIKRNAGKYVNAFAHGLEDNQPSAYDAHLFTLMLKENHLIEKHLNRMKPWFKKSEIKKHQNDILKSLETCKGFERKYLKREMILYPALEQRLPTTKPLEVLWSLHDDARSTLKQLLSHLKEDDFDIDQFILMLGDYYNQIFGLNRNERLILFPVADQLLDIDTKQQLFEESKAYGYVFIDKLPKTSYHSSKSSCENGFIKTKTGQLSIDQFNAVMQYIPLDITFVDENDKVQFFNDRKERHFPRNPSIIGRLVKHCHPPKSVHIVKRIVDAFKNREKDMAEFWMKFKESFIYITYYAVRNKDNQYMGTLEVSQDVTHIQSLEGEQRLLNWE